MLQRDGETYVIQAKAKESENRVTHTIKFIKAESLPLDSIQQAILGAQYTYNRQAQCTVSVWCW